MTTEETCEWWCQYVDGGENRTLHSSDMDGRMTTSRNLYRRVLDLASPFVRHPTLLVDVLGGRNGVVMGHAEAEVGRARRLYSEQQDGELESVVNKIVSGSCCNYGGVFLYGVVRAMKADIVVETGVAAGLSSYAILQAMKDNDKGELYSIDLGSRSDWIPKGSETGYLVPDNLRHRWHLRIGDSRRLLPELLEELGALDMFVHDSLHTYEHMMFEFQTAWPKIRSGGLLLSDDIWGSNVFADFCEEYSVNGTVMERQWHGYTNSFGWVKKKP